MPVKPFSQLSIRKSAPAASDDTTIDLANKMSQSNFWFALEKNKYTDPSFSSSDVMWVSH